MTKLTPRAAAVDWTDRADTAGYLTDLVPDLICRVRDDDPDLNAAWIARRVPAHAWPAFVLILAAHIPIDRSQAELVAWALPVADPSLWRDGHRQYVALRSRGVPADAIDPEIADAERRYHAARYAAGYVSRAKTRREKRDKQRTRLAVPAAITPKPDRTTPIETPTADPDTATEHTGVSPL